MRDLVKKVKKDSTLTVDVRTTKLYDDERHVCKMLSAINRITNVHAHVRFFEAGKTDPVVMRLNGRGTPYLCKLPDRRKGKYEYVTYESSANILYKKLPKSICHRIQAVLPQLTHRIRWSNAHGGSDSHIHHMFLPYVRLLEAEEDGLCCKCYLDFIETPNGLRMELDWEREGRKHKGGFYLSPSAYADTYTRNAVAEGCIHPELQKLRALKDHRSRLPLPIALRQVDALMVHIEETLL